MHVLLLQSCAFAVILLVPVHLVIYTCYVAITSLADDDLLLASVHILVPFLDDRFKTVCPMLSDCCLSCPVCLVCDVGVLWPNCWTHQDETWHAGRPRPWPHCVRWGPRSPSPKGPRPPPNFRPISVVAKWRDGSRCHLVGR